MEEARQGAASPPAAQAPDAIATEAQAAGAAASPTPPPAEACEVPSGGQPDILVIEHGSGSEATGAAVSDAGEHGEGTGEGFAALEQGTSAAAEADAAADALEALRLKEEAVAVGSEDAASPSDSIKAHTRLSLPAQASSASTSSSRRPSKRLTFTAPPKCLQGLPHAVQRANYSHSPQRVRQILTDNERLVKRLSVISVQRPAHEEGQEEHDLYMANVAASSAARRAAEASRVMRQNLRIYRRLQEVRPSRDVARGGHERDFAKHERMLATLAALRRRSTAASKSGRSSKRQSAAPVAPAAPAPAVAAEAEVQAAE